MLAELVNSTIKYITIEAWAIKSDSKMQGEQSKHMIFDFAIDDKPVHEKIQEYLAKNFPGYNLVGLRVTQEGGS